MKVSFERGKGRKLSENVYCCRITKQETIPDSQASRFISYDDNVNFVITDTCVTLKGHRRQFDNIVSFVNARQAVKSAIIVHEIHWLHES